jgi:hypothetical protein
VPSGLVYGRLTESVARDLMSQSPDTESAAWLRGRSALDPPVQTAEIEFLRQGIQPHLVDPHVDMADDEAVIAFAGLPEVRLRRVDGVMRPEQCGGEPVPAHSWQIIASDD